MADSRIRLSIVGILLLTLQSGAWAWGHPGHQLIGSLADEMLAGSNASKKVASILGPGVKDLKTAAPWPDCARDVKRVAGGGVKYIPDPKFHSAACAPFETGAERSRMEDFAKRNWSNCEGGAANKPACNRRYHFTNVATQHDGYDRKFIGTADNDIVAAIRAAVGVLRKGPPAAAPFDIKDSKEALLLIAHFAGDIHQPLHVGDLYLSDEGKMLDPDAGNAPFNPDSDTLGGNRLEVGSSSNLHSEWDGIPDAIKLTSLQTGPGKLRRAALISAARATPATPGAVENWAETWASDTIKASHAAFPGLRFTRKGALKEGDWSVQFSDQAGYIKAQQQLQQQQVVKAAAHLAQLLKAVWP